MFPHSLLTVLVAAGLALPALPAMAQTVPRARAQPERASQRGVPYAGNEEAMLWADQIAQRNGLDADWVRRAIGRAQFLPTVVRLMQPAPSGTAKNWRAYRSRFIDPVRIAAGLRFWLENQSTLERAQQVYGVPPQIIVGIIGVETLYGRQMGSFRVIDALATLAFDFPQSHPRAAERSAYFRGELEQFLLLQQRRGADPLAPLGSYAGAMGMAQFMPGSLARWAVDFDGDGRTDLATSAADAIGSVANYFKSYGWQPGMPAYYPVSFDAGRLDLEALLAPDILPTFSVASFTAKGALLQGPALAHKGPLALVELQNGDDPPQYVAGTENFYVITRYNWSSYYAMAVIELGQQVRQAMVANGALGPDAPSDPAAAADASVAPAAPLAPDPPAAPAAGLSDGAPPPEATPPVQGAPAATPPEPLPLPPPSS